jgi:hypothetical protein
VTAPEEWAERVAALLNEMTADRVTFDLCDGEVSVEGGDWIVTLAPTVEDVWRVERA